ncbi:MAG: hypothetical protein J7L64_03045 [Acidobacteria bacterium]|nr:hypothetical protein [Acidobacteriota bacterium]
MAKRSSGGLIVAHIFFVVGCYVITWGIKGSASFKAVLTDPLFWGLIALLGGFCTIAVWRRGAK